MVTIRKAAAGDAGFVAKHAYRLLDFELPSWRRSERDMMTIADQRHLKNALDADNPDIAIYIAEEDGQPAGFIHLVTQQDYYTSEVHAHVTDIVVIADAEGKGIAKLLFQKADEWAREKNARWITLNVFEGNERARAFYKKAGYNIEWIKYLKELK